MKAPIATKTVPTQPKETPKAPARPDVDITGLPPNGGKGSK